MDSAFTLELQALWKVLAVGLVLGAGLPVLFAVGVRAMAYGTGGSAEVAAHGQRQPPHPAGRVVAAICFGIVVAAVLIGITFVVVTGLGKALSFEHIYPTIVEKS